MTQKKLWWHEPLRVIQTNLQVKDTGKMDPAKIAQEIYDMGGNVLVMNVGGIYGWYPSKVPYHTVNPYLPQGFDLLERMIEECHKRGVRLVARYDFSKTSDNVYQRRPQWFSRNVDGAGQPIGVLRPGAWDLLYQTCINSGYRNEEVAVKVLTESLSRYDIDGVFFNAPHPTNCHCTACQEKYYELYGTKLPEDEKQWDKRWKSTILKDNITKLNAAVKAVKPDIPTILYYAIASDNLYERLDTCDMICAEPQDVLSLGWKEIPQSFKPALCIRLGCSEPSIPRPFGIIHSCPGMDWRHTGLPPAEYMYWMSQVPANGGQIWHSITGFADTITDKRILKCVSDINHQIAKVQPAMHGAKSNAKAAILWNMDVGDQGKAFGGQVQAAANGWAESLLAEQIPFDMLLPEQVCAGRLKDYALLIAPEGIPEEGLYEAVKAFVRNGGNALIECAHTPNQWEAELMGINAHTQYSEYLRAAYLRFEENAEDLRSGGLENTPIIAYRGHMSYVTPKEGTEVLCTLVPPFAPMEAVGAPPERASLSVERTDLALVMQNAMGGGCVMSLSFGLSALISDLKLNEHMLLAANMVRKLLGKQLDVRTTPLRGMQLMDYAKGDMRILHVVNGVGQRPLSQNVPIPMHMELDWAGEMPKVTSLLNDVPQVKLEGGVLYITTAPVLTWDVLVIEK